ncbi:MAG: Tetratricopeptide repeat protein [Acidobacteriaceae bacterium]|nr:Tetratricopeptide repeat protein [Acidobacteriaceae bacterium]
MLERFPMPQLKRHALAITIMIVACLAYASSFGQTLPAQQSSKLGENSSAAAPHPAPSVFADVHRLMQQGKYDEALEQLQSLAVQNPKIEGLHHELGAAYYKKGNYSKAAEEFKQATQANPEDREAVQLLGLSDYLAGRPAEAIPYLERVQTWYSFANVDASYILGICHIQAKDYPHARVAFARMFDVPADSASSYLFTARMLLRQEFDPIAEEYAQKAAALDPKLPLVHFLLGELYLYKSRIPEAISELQKELANNPAYAPAYYKLADAYTRIQKFDDAERLLQRSIWLDATSTGPYILMGKVLEKKGEFDLAARALQRAAAMDPNNSITHHLLGQTYRDLGRPEDAERELKIAEQLQQNENKKP